MKKVSPMRVAISGDFAIDSKRIKIYYPRPTSVRTIMLTKRQILASNRHDKAVGQRVTGHFDHDASNISGPRPHRQQLSARGGSAVSIDPPPQNGDRPNGTNMHVTLSPSGEVTFG